MKEGLRPLKFFLTLLIVISAFHLSLVLYNGQKGISGNAVGGVEDGRGLSIPILLAPPGENSISTWLILGGEWGLIGVVALLFFTKRRKIRKEEYNTAVVLKNKIHLTGTATAIDNLYELLKIKKSLRLSTIGRLYGVKPDVVMIWGQTMENGNLATIVYPRFGEPGLIYRNKTENPAGV